MTLEQLCIITLTPDNRYGKNGSCLALLMGMTPTRKTQMLNNPGTMNAEEIKKLVEVLNTPEITAEILISEYGCGRDKLNISEAEMLAIKPLAFGTFDLTRK